MNKFAKRAVTLFILWGVSNSILSALLWGVRIRWEIVNEGSKFTTSPLSTIMVFLFVAVYFVPMMYSVHRYAKSGQLKWLIIISKIFLILYIAAFAVAGIALLTLLVLGKL